MAIAINVKRFTGMPKMIQQRMAVNISSRALAKVFKMEFNDLRNSAVTMPMPALLMIIATTFTCQMDVKLDLVKAIDNMPVYCRAKTLQRMESMYINTF